MIMRYEQNYPNFFLLSYDDAVLNLPYCEFFFFDLFILQNFLLIYWHRSVAMRSIHVFNSIQQL